MYAFSVFDNFDCDPKLLRWFVITLNLFEPVFFPRIMLLISRAPVKYKCIGCASFDHDRDGTLTSVSSVDDQGR